MTKKSTAHQKANKKADTDAPGASTSGSSLIERAFTAGNYADVRTLARSDPSDAARSLLALVRVDMGQFAVGLVAFGMVLLAAFLTLK